MAQLKKEAVVCFETSVPIYGTKWSHIPEDRKTDIRNCEIIKGNVNSIHRPTVVRWPNWEKRSFYQYMSWAATVKEINKILGWEWRQLV